MSAELFNIAERTSRNGGQFDERIKPSGNAYKIGFNDMFRSVYQISVYVDISHSDPLYLILSDYFKNGLAELNRNSPNTKTVFRVKFECKLLQPMRFHELAPCPQKLGWSQMGDS